MQEPYETMEINGFKVEIYRDEFSESPRDWDNRGTMVCWHRRYTLGDEQPTEGVMDWMRQMVCDITGEDHDDPNEAFDKLFITLPLYLYDHSGITMSTGRFSCPWDSGQVGLIYITNERAKEEFGWKRLTKARIEKVLDCLRYEVKSYDQFLTGDVYGFKIFNPEGEETDSCWGFYGDNWKENSLLDEAEGRIEWEIRYQAKQDAAVNVCMAL